MSAQLKLSVRLLLSGKERLILDRFSVRLAVAMLLFLLGVVAPTACLSNSSPKQEVRATIPNDPWVHIFFELPNLSSKSINEITSEANLPNLRTVMLSGDDLEVRVWIIADEHGRALILRRSNGQWSAIHIRGMGREERLQKQETQLAPKSGWEKAWERLVSAKLLTLPDGSEENCKALVLDGISYIVELNANRAYRTYRYGNPQFAKCDEAKQMIKVAEIIDEEFGWELPEGR